MNARRKKSFRRSEKLFMQMLSHSLGAEARDAQRFRYLAKIELNHSQETAELREAQYLFLASDDTMFWGDTYAEAVDKAMAHDRQTLFFTEPALSTTTNPQLPNSQLTNS